MKDHDVEEVMRRLLGFGLAQSILKMLAASSTGNSLLSNHGLWSVLRVCNLVEKKNLKVWSLV